MQDEARVGDATVLKGEIELAERSLFRNGLDNGATTSVKSMAEPAPDKLSEEARPVFEEELLPMPDWDMNSSNAT